MAGRRPPLGIPPNKQPIRPSYARPTAGSRNQSHVPLLRRRSNSGPGTPAIPALSVVIPKSGPKSGAKSSQKTSPADTEPSPTLRQNGAKTRKEQGCDDTTGEETNIYVVVRCRGRNDREVKENSGVVVSTDGVKGKTVELSMGPNALTNKTYHFDKVFSPAADQSMVYDDVVAPFLDQVSDTIPSSTRHD